MTSLTPSFGPAEQQAASRLIQLALDEDLGDRGDVTSLSLIPAEQTGTVHIVCRQNGLLAGLPVAQQVFQSLDPTVKFQPRCPDGSQLAPGDVVAEVHGPVRSLLTGERTALNFLTHLSGIASLTGQFVEQVQGTAAQMLDTRKTLPGYRVLEKYAVRCGGGTNHRMGLYDGVLIKDNHLAAWTQDNPLPAAIRQAREATGLPVEVEVDTLEQLRAVLPANPAIVLLDNFSLDDLRTAVAYRNEFAPNTLLEASGGINLQTVRAIAQTGVDRISSGALTHSAPALDLAFDWC